MSAWIKANQLTVKKTGSYYVTHITVAASVAYMVTGDFVASFTLSLLEPTVQAFVYFFHERLWLSLDRARKLYTEDSLADADPTEGHFA
jgi:uncharacterized membrane protein